jgi:ubiquinone/menaquinone biosynthesis C-methylase UbiE
MGMSFQRSAGWSKMARMRLPWSRRIPAAALALLAALLATAAFGQGNSPTPGTNEAEREHWQNVDEIFAAMGVSKGSRVADVGAGSGFFTVRLARAVGATGRVFAVDINPRLVHELGERVTREKLQNIEVITGEPADPHLPGSLDAVLIVNAYHEMDEHQVMLDRIRQALKLEGRLVIVEPIARIREKTSRAEQRANHEIAIEYVLEDLRQAGFRIVEGRPRFVENLLDRDTEWLISATPLY